MSTLTDADTIIKHVGSNELKTHSYHERNTSTFARFLKLYSMKKVVNVLGDFKKKGFLTFTSIIIYFN